MPEGRREHMTARAMCQGLLTTKLWNGRCTGCFYFWSIACGRAFNKAPPFELPSPFPPPPLSPTLPSTTPSVLSVAWGLCFQLDRIRWSVVVNHSGWKTLIRGWHRVESADPVTARYIQCYAWSCAITFAVMWRWSRFFFIFLFFFRVFVFNVSVCWFVFCFCFLHKAVFLYASRFMKGEVIAFGNGVGIWAFNTAQYAQCLLSVLPPTWAITLNEEEEYSL